MHHISAPFPYLLPLTIALILAIVSNVIAFIIIYKRK
jgi:hypothetical protein